MTAQRQHRGTEEIDLPEDPLVAARDPLEVAREHVAAEALREDSGGRVGLELELHLVDLARAAARPTWTQAARLATGVGPLPGGSSVTLEPGGQIELSTPPADDVVAAVAALRADERQLRERLRAEGFGAAALGTDPARAVARINPGARYAAMETHFDALGCAGAGQAMMTATAALQVNLDAGPAAGWSNRLGLIRRLVPLLVAASATSPYLAGRSSGWHSMRQATWQGIDHGRSDPVPPGEPTQAWAQYALDAPVMLVSAGGQLRPVTSRVSFADWLRGTAPFGRRPTMADLDYHLTTLFPPVRPRGYVEIRCVDALPSRWWPAVAALVVTLVDDPVATDLVADLAAPIEDPWRAAAEQGLDDPAIRRAVTACAALAASRAPAGLRHEVEELAELFASGRSPSSLLRTRVESRGALAVLEEEAHA